MRVGRRLRYAEPLEPRRLLAVVPLIDGVAGIGPIAVDDAAETIGRAPVVIPVLENDLPADPPNDYPIRPESVVIVQPPVGGTATVDAQTGAITYRADPGFSGEDTLQYTVRDAAPVGGEPQSAIILPRGSVWKYLSGPDQGTAWIASGFNDAAWLFGPAEIGFGDGGEATVVTPGGVGTHTTIYFRSTFNLTDASAVQQLTLRLRFDDGIAVYINGQEIERQNLAAGARYTDYALNIAADDGANYNPFVKTRATNELGMLIDGVNTIAAEVHQQSAGSSDISFDLEVEAQFLGPTGRVSNPATVAIAVASTNEPPTANDDDALTKIGEPIEIDVVANDVPDGAPIDPATLTIVDGPSNGTIELLSGGRVRYTPGNDFLGDDIFTYTVRDTDGRASNLATVSIRVASSIVTATDDRYYAEEDDALIVSAQFGVLANDMSDGGTVAAAAVVTPPQHGTLALADDGSFQYMPNADFFGDDLFRYRAIDNHGESAEANVTIRITPVPDAPIALNDAFSTPTDTPLVVIAAPPERHVLVPAGAMWRYLDNGVSQGSAWRQLNVDDSAWLIGQAEFGYGDGDETTVVNFGDDIDSKHITTYFRHELFLDDARRVHGLRLGLLRDDGGAVYINNTSVANSNLPTSFNFNTPAVSVVSGDDERTYFPFDLDNRLSLLVTGRNVIAVEVHQASPTSNDMSFDLYLHGDVAGPVTDGVLLNDADADGDYLTAVLVSPPEHGTLEFSADGGFVYTPNPGYVGADAFTYRANDGALLSNVATVVIDVTPPASPAADLNGDRVVDEADLAVVVAGLGMAGGADKSAGDVDGDGRVDLRDAMAVQRAFGQSEPAGLAPAAIIAARRGTARDAAGDIDATSVKSAPTQAPPPVRESASMRASRRGRSAASASIEPRAVDVVFGDGGLLRAGSAARGAAARRAVSGN